MKQKLNGALTVAALISFAGANAWAKGPTVRDHRTGGAVVRDHRTQPIVRDHRQPKLPVGIMVQPRPPKPIGIVVPPKPIGIKPIGIMVPPKPIGIVKPPVIGIKPIGIVKPPVIGIVKPPVVGIVKPPVIGIVKPPVIGIVKPPVKPPVVGIIGIKPPKPIGIIVGIKPPVKPPVIGIVLPPKPKPPIVIGIIVHPPHYPHYPHWPHWPHCPRRPFPGGYGYPVVVGQPYPVTVPVAQNTTVYNLQCALPEGTQAQGLTSVNVNLMETSEGNFQVFGVLLDEESEEENLNVMARGTLGNDVNLSLDNSDEIVLELKQDQQGNKFLQGRVTLGGNSDQNGLACALSQVQMQQ